VLVLVLGRGGAVDRWEGREVRPEMVAVVEKMGSWVWFWVWDERELDEIAWREWW
jgi:hypothetical protein